MSFNANMSSLSFHLRPLLRIIQWVTPLYSFLTLTLFFCVADQALGHKGLLPINATILCIALIMPFLFFSAIPQRGPRGYHSPYLELVWGNRLVVGCLIAIASIAGVLAALPDAYWGEGGKWIGVIPYDCAIAIASLAIGVHRWTRQNLSLVVLSSQLFLLGSLWWDTLHPGTFAELTNRAAGFPGNANYAALVANIVCAAGLDFCGALSSHNKKSFLLDLSLLTATFLIVAMTMSRSGLLAFGVVIFCYLFFRVIRTPRSAQRKAAELLVLCIVALAAFSFISWHATDSGLHSGKSRLTRLLNRQQVDDGSAGTRLAALYDGLRLIEEAPLLGHGTGFARTMHELPHNIYVQQWVNNGLPGIAAYLLFLAAAYRTFAARGFRNGQVVILVATVGGLFSHNVLDQRPFLMLLGILLASSYQEATQFYKAPARTSFTRSRVGRVSGKSTERT